jgi:hypothetical protein
MADSATCPNWSEPTFPSIRATLNPLTSPFLLLPRQLRSAEAVISLGVKHRGHEADHSPLCFHSPCTFMVCTGISLPLPLIFLLQTLEPALMDRDACNLVTADTDMS